jgi:hypothetical protein
MFLEPFDRGFNAALLHIASRLFSEGFDASPDAPDTYETLKAHFDAGKRFVVSSLHSDMTIYGAPEINYAFRAWHDWCHWRGEHHFTLDGETGVCRMQQAQLRAFAGYSGQTESWCDLLYAEVVGQQEYFLRHADFPSNQSAFVRAYLNDRERAIAA